MSTTTEVTTVVLLGAPGELVDAVSREFEARLLDGETARYRTSHELPADFLILSNEEITRHILVVVSTGTTTKHDENLEAAVSTCLRWNVPVFFVFDPQLGAFNEQAPVVLHHINAIALDDRHDVRHVVTHVLRLMGVEENERSVFISYAQADGTPWAYELRRLLIDDGWDVFLDRLSIEPGVDFQKTLTRDLDGRSLVLVIDTPMAPQRDWVTWELAYARENSIGIMGFATKALGAHVDQVDDDRRFTADVADENATALGAAERSRFLRMAQLVHSKAWRSRRSVALQEASDALTSDGYSVEPLTAMALAAEKAGHRRIVVHVLPRPPRADDLRDVHRLRGSKLGRRGSDGWIVHTHRQIAPDQQSLLRWLSKRRPLQVCYVGDFRGSLR